MVDGTTVYILAGVDAGTYAILAFQLARARRRGPPRRLSARDAFAAFGAEVGRVFPAISPGFTWHEAVAESKKRGLAVDWSRVESELDAYEGERYGGKPESDLGCEEIGRLAEVLRRSR